MKFFYLTRALQATALASAVLLAAPDIAQTTAADTPAATGTTAEQAIRSTTRAQNRAQGIKPRYHAAPRHSRRGNTSAGEPANASRLATDRGHTATDYERNAVARCEVFKNSEDTQACIQRVRQSPQGSVEGGGLLREYSYEVPAGGS